MSKEQVFADIKAHIAHCGGSYSSWYVGIAADPRDRLFNRHSVSETGDSWIYRICDSNQDARTVENALLRLGTKGGPSGGDNATKSVYAYKIGPHTLE